MEQISIKKFAVKAFLLALIPAVIVALLFGVIGGNRLIAVLAAVCVTVGCFLCFLLILYARAVTAWTKAHPANNDENAEDTPAEETEAREEDKE